MTCEQNERGLFEIGREGLCKKITAVLLTGYALLLAYWMLLGFGRTTQESYMYNVLPFHTILQFFGSRDFLSSAWLINIVGNIGVFVPFGIGLPILCKGKLQLALPLFLLGVLVLELLQLVLRRGSFDVDDFILNTAGFWLGYALFRQLPWLHEQQDQKE